MVTRGHSVYYGLWKASLYEGRAKMQQIWANFERKNWRILESKLKGRLNFRWTWRPSESDVCCWHRQKTLIRRDQEPSLDAEQERIFKILVFQGNKWDRTLKEGRRVTRELKFGDLNIWGVNISFIIDGIVNFRSWSIIETEVEFLQVSDKETSSEV